MAGLARVPAPAPRPNPWVRSPSWDTFWILSPLWVAPVVWFTSRRYEVSPYEADFFWVMLVLTFGFWIGHRVSSTYLAYCTSAYRPLLRSQRVRFLWVPIGIVVFTVGFLTLPDDALPWTRARRRIYLVIADYGLITYHFASQHFGFLSLYRLRAGQARSPGARRLDRAYALVVGGLFVFVAEWIAGNVFYPELWLDPWIDPDRVAAHHGAIQAAGVSLTLLATAVMIAREWRDPRGSLPRTLYLVTTAGIVLLAFFVHPAVFLALWTSQHWLAAMGLSTVVARADRAAPAPSRWYRLWAPVSRRPWALTLVLVAFSIVLLPVMEVEALGDGEVSFSATVAPDLAYALLESWWFPWLIAIGFVTAFLHYALDRAVFRLSDPEVREAARGLFEQPRNGQH